jgi:hypothetical protein
MRKGIYIIAAVVSLYALYLLLSDNKSAVETEEKAQSLSLKKHSDAFNQSIDSILNAYLSISDGLVNEDTLKVKASSVKLTQLLSTIDTVELKKDTAAVFVTVMSTISDMQYNLQELQKQSDLQEMRKCFKNLTDVMYPAFFTSLQYEGGTVYLQNCPMAFEDEIPANWISNHPEIVNPYLGKNHPVYKSSMLHCGEIKDSLTVK